MPRRKKRVQDLTTEELAKKLNAGTLDEKIRKATLKDGHAIIRHGGEDIWIPISVIQAAKNRQVK